MKGLIYIFCVLLYFIPITNIAQPAISWEKTYGGSEGEVAFYITQTTDGGYIFIGQTNSNDGQVTGFHGIVDCWVVKTDVQGNIQWCKALGGSDADYALSIEQTTDGGYIVGGTSASTDGQVTGNHGDADFWIVKLDQNGNIQWQHSFGGTNLDKCYHAGQTSDGGYYAIGWTKSSDGQVSGFHGLADYWFIRLDNSGNLLWQKTLGGSGRDYGTFAQQTNDGGFILTGTSNSTDGDVTGNHGDYDYWVVKLDQSGNLVWQKSLGGTGDDESTCIRLTTDRNYITTGVVTSNDGQVSGNHGTEDYWVVKLNATGNIIWQNCYGGSWGEKSTSINLTSDGGYIVGGYSGSEDGQVTGNHGATDYWVVKINSSGVLQWEESLGGSNDDYGNCVQQTSDGGYIVTGETQSNDGDVSGNHGFIDMWTVKLSSITGIPSSGNLSDIQVYPCPAENELHIKSESKISEIRLFDVNNQQISVPIHTAGTSLMLDVSSLPSGIYFVSCVQNNTVKTKKILIYK